MDSLKKTIMYVFNDSSLGGAAQSLMDTLKDMGEEIRPIVVMREGIKIKDRFEALGICCYEIPFFTDQIKMGNVTKEKRESDFKQSYEAATKLIYVIEKEKVQLIHINSSISYFAAIAALMAEVPYVWHIREIMDEHYGCESLNNGLKQYLYEQSDKLIAISDYVQKMYYDKYKMTTQRIYNGLVIQRYKQDIDMNKSFHSIFLIAAVIMPQKGQWDAIKAVELLINKGHKDVKLIIVGEGEERYVWALKKYIKKQNLSNNVVILPFHSDLSELRESVSYALTCSQSEALGRVTIESMLAGNLVIGARSGGTIEIVGENEERGFLYELHNSRDLANTMMKAIQCPEDMKIKMLKDAQIYAEKTFDSKEYCVELSGIYNQVISSYKTKIHEDFLYQLKERYNLISNKTVFTCQENDTRLLRSQIAFTLATRWLSIKQKGYNLEEYFVRHNIRSIAIYGMALLGCRLYDELEDGTVDIRYLIDKNPGVMKTVLSFAEFKEHILDIDAIVVTVAAAEKEVISEIKKMGYGTVIGLSEVLDELYIM